MMRSAFKRHDGLTYTVNGHLNEHLNSCPNRQYAATVTGGQASLNNVPASMQCPTLSSASTFPSHRSIKRTACTIPWLWLPYLLPRRPRLRKPTAL